MADSEIFQIGFQIGVECGRMNEEGKFRWDSVSFGGWVQSVVRCMVS